MHAVIMITAYGDIDLAVRSLKEGAFDFVVKPWHNEKLMATIKEALKEKETKASATHAADFFNLLEQNCLVNPSHAGYFL